MDNEAFEIILTRYGGGKKKYRIQVEIFYRSGQVIRCRVFAGKKSMIMEKLLLKHKGQWKIKEMNFPFSGDIKSVSQTILDIQDEIDFYLAGSPKPVNKYKNK
ncbi:MAG: hypothetical protein SFU87_08210 [Chitinophagaceae bacterium]|nr:hypothetical protein [Chitinophagaceae bacterium]